MLFTLLFLCDLGAVTMQFASKFNKYLPIYGIICNLYHLLSLLNKKISA